METKPLFKHKKLIRVSAIILLLVLSGAYCYHRQNVPPVKPDPISRGDYNYVVDYAAFRTEQLMKQHHLPSMAVALIDDQQIVWQEAFGMADLEREIPATTTTVYKMWSVSKVFTALETMRLVEEGLLALDDPITNYLPNFSIQSRFPAEESITIRNLLSHHAGLPRNECHHVALGREMLANLVHSLSDCHLAYPTGDRYKYSNIGFDTLGFLVEKMRGQPFPEVMRENLLDPLGMEHSAFLRLNIPKGAEVASGYAYYEGEYIPYEQGDITSLPSGNLYASLEDMSKFMRFVLNNGASGGEQMLAPDTLPRMFENQFPNSAQPMGLGWKTAQVWDSEQLVWHDGGPSEGIGSLIAMLPERKLGVVLIANEVSFEGAVSVSLALEILERMLETKFESTPPEVQAAAGIEVDSAQLKKYEGTYIAMGQALEVSAMENHLAARISGLTLNLVPANENQFRVSHWLFNLGLADLLPLPIDPTTLKIEFRAGIQNTNAVLIINFFDVFHELAPRYPDFKEEPPFWEAITGKYELHARTPSGAAGKDVLGRTRIFVEEGILHMDGFVGPILPISDTELIILSGSFDGETMWYEPETGYIFHQAIVYIPARDE